MELGLTSITSESDNHMTLHGRNFSIHNVGTMWRFIIIQFYMHMYVAMCNEAVITLVDGVLVYIP